MTSSDIVSVDQIVHASPKAIFEVLADPRQHPVIDGSGTVRKTQGATPQRLSLGAKFGMDMKVGIPYKITNEVIEFDEGKQIAWRHFGGHVWRYMLEPVEGGTKVTEQFDYTNARSKLFLKVTGAIPKNKKAMSNTLRNLEKRFTTPK